MKLGDIVVLPSHLKNPMTVTQIMRVLDWPVGGWETTGLVTVAYFDHEGQYGSATLDSAVLLPYQPKPVPKTPETIA